MRSVLVKVMTITSIVLLFAYNLIVSNGDYSLFITLILAGFVVSTILVFAFDLVMTSWLRAWVETIDFFIDAYFKEKERREKER